MLPTEFDGRDMTKRYRIPNLVKPFFIIYNSFAYLTYFAIFIYCKRRCKLFSSADETREFVRRTLDHQ